MFIFLHLHKGLTLSSVPFFMSQIPPKLKIENCKSENRPKNLQNGNGPIQTTDQYQFALQQEKPLIFYQQGTSRISLTHGNSWKLIK